MGRKLLFILALLILSCNKKEKSITVFKKEIHFNQPDKDTKNWIQSFNEFRNALYQNDKGKLKSFFKFPVLNEGNEIWYIIEDEHQLTFEKGEIKPFTETDFNNYYHKLFDQYFINSLLKIDTEKLLRNGYYETGLFSDGELSYNMNAKHDKVSKQIVLSFYTEEKIETGKNEYEKSEFSKIYYFDIVSNNKLQFRQVRVAG